MWSRAAWRWAAISLRAASRSVTSEASTGFDAAFWTEEAAPMAVAGVAGGRVEVPSTEVKREDPCDDEKHVGGACNGKKRLQPATANEHLLLRVPLVAMASLLRMGARRAIGATRSMSTLHSSTNAVPDKGAGHWKIIGGVILASFPVSYVVYEALQHSSHRTY